MADTESLGPAGVEWLEHLAALPEPDRQVRIPTITDPRGTDFAAAARLRQQDWMLDLERRAIAAFQAMGILMTDTCINYQTIMPAVRGEHMAYGDTGVVIYSNSVLGARSNFEGGPSALAAGLTGRTPRYGYHLDEHRRASLHVAVTRTPAALHEWGTLGALVGRLAGDYWQVPVLSGIDRVPGSDELKHFGAALASYGSVALFHMVGITPEAQRFADVADAALPLRATIGAAEMAAFRHRPGGRTEPSTWWCSPRPQLSLFELRDLAALLDGRRVTVPLLAVTSPQVKPDADRARADRADRGRGRAGAVGDVLLPELRARDGRGKWLAHLATNSAKLVNILGGYGYRPVLASMEACVAAACSGRLAA